MKKSLLKSKLKQIFLKHKLSKNHAEICSNYLVKAEILEAKDITINFLKENGAEIIPVKLPLTK